MDKLRNVEGPLFALATGTFFLWFYQVPTVYVTAIYLGLFGLLFLLKRPVIDYVAILLFSVFGRRSQVEVSFILVGVLLIGLTIGRLREKQFVMGRLLIPMAAYGLYAALSTLWAPRTLDALAGVFMLLEGYLVYVILTNSGWKPKEEDKERVSKLATFLLLTLTMEILTLYVQHGFTETLYKKYLVDLGWGFSNLIAVTYTFFLPVAFAKYLDRDTYRPLYYLLDVVNVCGLLLTQSRGAIVGVMVGLLLYVPLTCNRDYLKKYYPLLLGIVTFALLFFEPYVLEVINRFIKPDILDDNNRFPLYELAFAKFKERPLFGYGYKSSEYFINTILKRSNAYYHNYILQIAATLGVTGLFLQGILHYLWVRLFMKRDPFLFCLALGVLSALVHQLVDVSYDRFYFGLFLYFLIGMAELFRHHDGEDSWKMKRFSTTNR